MTTRTSDESAKEAKAAYDAARRARCRDEGRCTRCTKVLVNGRERLSRCLRCERRKAKADLAGNRRRNAALRARRRAAGLCIFCAEESPDKAVCAACNKAACLKAKERRATRRAADASRERPPAQLRAESPAFP